MARSALLNVMVQAAIKAGKSLSRDFGEVQNLQVSVKGPSDFVSQADLKAEKIVRDELMKARPTYDFLGEEGGEEKGTDGAHRWIVDPLDGTTNFLHGFPAYGVSICVALDGVPQAAVVHDVARGGVYHAQRGAGAFVDDTALRVSELSAPARALIGTGFPFKDVTRADEYLRMMRRLMPEVSGMRRAGSAALDLCDVARGRFDAFWELWLNPWDYAAGLLLVQEAGGRVTDLAGREVSLNGGTIVASNGVLHDWFLERLNAN